MSPPTASKSAPARPAPADDARGLARAVLCVFIFWLLLAFAVDQVRQAWGEARPLAEQWGLDGREFFRGRWWSPLSYPFIHFGPLHLVLNAGALALFGLALGETWPWRRLALLTFVSALGGAGLWLALHHGQRGAVIGASAIVCGYLTAFVLERPLAPVPLPGLPWGFPRWVLLALLIGIEGRGLWLEARSRLAPGALSHSAHLGGALAAVALHLYWRTTDSRKGRRGRS